MPKDKGKSRGPKVEDALPPESIVGALSEVYNDKYDVTKGEGDPVSYPVVDTKEGSFLDKENRIVSETRKERRKHQAASIITPMQEIFITSYVAYRDKLRAAQDAGYAPSIVKVMGKRLLNQSYYPLVAKRIKELLHKQQELAVMDGAAVLKYVHTIMQFSPADWFLPGDDGGWIMDMDDVRVLPQEIKSIIEHIEMKNIEGVDGTRTSKMWVRFVSKTQALAIAARYQLGDLNKDNTPVVQIDWSRLFGRGPVSVTQTTTTTSISSSNSRSKALPRSDGDVTFFQESPDGEVDDVVERSIRELESLPTTTVTEKVRRLGSKK